MGTWYGNKLVSVGDDVWFYKFGTTITSGYASKSGTFGNCHGKVTSLYDASYAFPIVISGKVTAGTGGSFTSCTVKAADLNWGYQNYITYNGNGGTASTAHQTGYVGASLTGTASRTGYTFAGWYNSSGTKYTTIPDSNGYTFYAHWTANKYTVTLNNDGATTAGTTSVTATYASAMPAITKPTKTGYTFGGYYYGTTPYYTAAGASARSYDYAGARTLTARWTANTYTVHFDGNGASTGTMADQPFTYNTTQQLTGNGFSRGAAYLFTGWNTSPDGTGTAVAENYSASKLTATNGATVTLYAQWQLQYLSPSINNVLAQRFEDGAADDVGTCVHVAFDWAVDLQVSPTNYATAVEIKYREQGTQAWTPLETITYSGQSASSISNTVNYTSPTGKAETDKNYDIFVGVTDYYGSHLDPPIPAPQATANTFLSVAFFTLDFSVGDPTATPPIQGGHGMGIGAPAPPEGLYVGMDTTFGADTEFEGDVSVGGDVALGGLTLQQYIGNICYPVGAYFITEGVEDPTDIFGGTWARIEDRFILAKGTSYPTAGGTGGAATVTLNETQIPAHQHEVVKWTKGTKNTASKTGFFQTNASGGSGWQMLTGYDSTRTHDCGTTATGGGKAHNNMPPYIVANVWKRTALAT